MRNFSPGRSLVTVVVGRVHPGLHFKFAAKRVRECMCPNHRQLYWWMGVLIYGNGRNDWRGHGATAAPLSGIGCMIRRTVIVVAGEDVIKEQGNNTWWHWMQWKGLRGTEEGWPAWQLSIARTSRNVTMTREAVQLEEEGRWQHLLLRRPADLALQWMDGWGGLWCRQERISLYWSLDVCVSMSGRPYAPHILVIDWAWFTYGLNVGCCEEDREWSFMFTFCCKKINDFSFFIKDV